MSERKIILGIDTSNYTTSVALMYDDGELIANIKRPLKVSEGERGLRQSEAVFSHVKNMPSAMAEAREYLNGRSPSAVGVSTRPRNVEGSYMPCFLSGVAVAEDLRGGAAALMCALCADGRSVIKNPQVILRGYENIEKKLAFLGASVIIK